MSEQNNTWNVRIQHKKDSAENWQSKNPVLLLNELIIVETEDGDCRFKIGDGVHAYSDLPFADQLLRDDVESKVSKEEGKALSSNDFTDDLKNKLDGISIMKGATADADGMSGLVPPPAQGADSKFLRGDGAWAALSPSDIGAAPTEHKHSASDITSGALPIEHGGTGGAAVEDARYNLGVPAEIDIAETSGFPFSWGTVCARGGLGNTIGQAAIGDNYYWGTDSQGYLWAGRQVNRATTPTWVRAAMMNGELGFTKIWAGNLTNGTIELPGARNYAALMVYGPPKGGEENVMSIVPAGSGIYVYHGGESSSLGYNTGSSNGHLAITITKNTEGGSITGIYAMVCAKA